MQELFSSLYAYNQWANEKIVQLCAGLTDAQLDQPREMGFGTLRKTLFHILTADVVWMERWESKPWREFPTDPDGKSIAEIAADLGDVGRRRLGLIEKHQPDGWNSTIEYLDSAKTPYRHQLHDLLLHVWIHGIHHRAQALNYLKQFDRTLPGGIDWIFYKLATGSTTQSSECVEAMTGHGMSVNETIGDDVQWHLQSIQRLFEYGDWAFEQVMGSALSLDDAALDREFDMGRGSIRKSLLHMYDAELFWVKNWTSGGAPFPHTAETTSMSELKDLWKANAAARNEYLANVGQQEALRVVEVSFGGPPIRILVGESAVQLTMHGAHHRAQVVNMCRHCETPTGNIDLLYALEHLSPRNASE